MARHINRPRRPASETTIRALRIAGWRYSTAREAWVHRAFRGRVGPVFIDPQYYNHPGVTDEVHFEASLTDVEDFASFVDLTAAERSDTPEIVIAEGERAPLPRRHTDRRDLTKVKVRLSDSEEPRVVAVDGRPPRRGDETLVIRPIDNVVPLKSAAAAS